MEKKLLRRSQRRIAESLQSESKCLSFKNFDQLRKLLSYFSIAATIPRECVKGP